MPKVSDYADKISPEIKESFQKLLGSDTYLGVMVYLTWEGGAYIPAMFEHFKVGPRNLFPGDGVESVLCEMCDAGLVERTNNYHGEFYKPTELGEKLVGGLLYCMQRDLSGVEDDIHHRIRELDLVKPE
jgi:hypothetical protein